MSVRLPLLGALAFGLGVAVGAPIADAGFDYTWRDADFCDDCHVHDYANARYWQSRHAGVTTCHDCHRVPIAHYPRNLWKLATVTYDDPSDIHTPAVPTLICGACHLQDGGHEELTGPMTDALRAQVVKVDRSPLHALHLEATTALGAEIGCLDCHGSGGASAHRFSSAPERCLTCHEGLAPTGGLAALDCRDCHIAGFVRDGLTGGRTN